MELVALSDHLGVEVRGVDLRSAVDEATASALRAAGDLVVWDNLSLQHGRRAVVGGERTLRRVAMVDTDGAEQRAWTKVSLAAEGKG